MTQTQHDIAHLIQECAEKHKGSLHVMRAHYVTMQREAARFLNPDAPEYKTLAAKVRTMSEIVRDLSHHIAKTEQYEPTPVPAKGYPAENALTQEGYTSTLTIVQAAERENMTLDQYLLALKNNKPSRGLQTASYNEYVDMARQAVSLELTFKSQFFTDDGKLYLKIK